MYTFEGIDSSFCVQFRRAKNGRIAVEHRGRLIDEVEAPMLFQAVLSDVLAFVSRPENQLPSNDPVREGLDKAIAEFNRTIGGDRKALC